MIYVYLISRYILNIMIYNNMWQSRVEIEGYSVAYFDRDI